MYIHNIRSGLYAMGYSNDSVRVYIGKIQVAAAWLKENKTGYDLDDVPGYVIAEWADTLPPSRASRNQARNALKAYWEFTNRELAPYRAIRVPKKPRMVCRAISETDTRTLAKTAREWEAGAEGIAVMFGLYMALRRFEIAKLRWDEFTDDWSEVTFMGKWSVEATLPVHPAIREKMAWWREFRVEDPTDMTIAPGDEYLFQGRPYARFEHVNPNTVWGWTKRIAASCGVEVTTHQLRHTCLATMNDKTKDLRAVQQYARHQDPEVTSGYTRVTKTRMDDCMESLDF